jgi:hypothetical protein
MNDPFKKYRKQFRSWKNKKRLDVEGALYHRTFMDRGLRIPDESKIQKTLQSKFPNIAPKSKGDLNILAIYHHYNWEDTALKPALEKFGRVRVYDWASEFNHQIPGWHEERKQAMNQDLIRKMEIWNREEHFDVIFTYLSGEIVSPETVASMRRFGAPMVNLALNDKELFVGKVRKGLSMGARDICRFYDICWTSTEDSLKKYCVEGALPIYLPEGANPEMHRPYEAEKIFDVSFVGQYYGNRPAIIKELKQRGIRVEAFGFGWPNGPLSLEDMVKLYSRSKINLGFGGVIGHKDTYCLKGRDFEIPMSGGLYLTEDHPELRRFFKPDKEIVTYTNVDDLVEKIQYLLSNPEKAEEIRKAGYERARNEHSWELRFEKIFQLMNLITPSPHFS